MPSANEKISHLTLCLWSCAFNVYIIDSVNIELNDNIYVYVNIRIYIYDYICIQYKA